MIVTSLNLGYRFPFHDGGRALCFLVQTAYHLDQQDIGIQLDDEGEFNIPENDIPQHVMDKIVTQYKVWATSDSKTDTPYNKTWCFRLSADELDPVGNNRLNEAKWSTRITERLANLMQNYLDMETDETEASFIYHFTVLKNSDILFFIAFDDQYQESLLQAFESGYSSFFPGIVQGKEV